MPAARLEEVSGVFFAPLELTQEKDAINRRVAEVFDRAGIPVVLLDRDLVPHPDRSRYDLVGIDNRRAGYTITSHLLRHGCQRVAFWGDRARHRRWTRASVDTKRP